jgi:3-methyladenine DNA glycosylase AlkD
MTLTRDSELRRVIRKLSSRERAEISQRFFKTGLGEYGEGDRFLGVALPDLRRLSLQYQDLPRKNLVRLLKSPWHEQRLLALLILIRQHARADERGRRVIYRLYLRNTRFINNWDLVDCSAEHIVGAYFANRNRDGLRRLAKSRSLWERRIAIISTLYYIKKGEFDAALEIAELLLEDEHDLIHKAVGWMLREIGKRDRRVEERFLRKHAGHMPRTMLRYAIKRFPEPLRTRYLAIRWARFHSTEPPTQRTHRLRFR